MLLTEREENVLSGIQKWEDKLLHYEPNDLQLTCEKYIDRAFSLLPEPIQENFFSVLDTWIFHLHSFIQGARFQSEAKERILSVGRIYKEDLQEIEDLKQLTIDQLQYIANQQIIRHRFYSFVQGGISGTGKVLPLSADIPAIAIMNLRVVQLIATTYGYEVNKPFEMMTSLKIFHFGTLPSRLQKVGWEQLKIELNEQKDPYFYEGNEDLADITWLEQPIKQILKAFFILLFKKKTIQGLPLISIGIGASMNYQITKKITDFAHNYYQRRFLLEKGDKR